MLGEQFDLLRNPHMVVYSQPGLVSYRRKLWLKSWDLQKMFVKPPEQTLVTTPDGHRQMQDLQLFGAIFRLFCRGQDKGSKYQLHASLLGRRGI